MSTPQQMSAMDGVSQFSLRWVDITFVYENHVGTHEKTYLACQFEKLTMEEL